MMDAAATKRNYTVYVSNIPEELNEIGIRAIFEHYGDITGFFYRTGTNWAYITYKSYLEAENAMRDLNDVPPLGLKLCLAKDRGANYANNAKSNSFAVNYNARRDVDSSSIISSNKFMAGENEHTIKNSLPSLFNGSAIKITYDKDVANASANALWARGELTVTSDAKRHVSLGRGYTSYEIPNPHLQVEHHIERVCEKRHPGLYQYGNDALRSQIGKCANCSNIARHKCQICHELYCCQECQIADWPKHKAMCIAPPALVAVTDAVSLAPSKIEEKMPSRRSSTVCMPLRPPKQLLQQQNANAPKTEAEHTNILEQKETVSPEIVKPALRHSNAQSTAAVPERIRQHVAMPNITQKEPVKKKEDDYNITIENANKIDEAISFLPRSNYMKVIVDVQVNDREYWIHKADNQSELLDLMCGLQDTAQTSPKCVKKIVGNLYIAKYSEMWNRCVLTSVRPLKVFFVDFGNEVEISEDDIRECMSFKETPYFARKIRLPQNVSSKYRNLQEGDTLSVKTLSIDKNMVINVAIEGESDEEPGPRDISTPLLPTQPIFPEAQFSKLSKLITSLKIGHHGILEISGELGKDTYGVTVLPYYSLSDFKRQIDEMNEECAKIKTTNPANSWSGLICGEKNGQWFRGFAISTSHPYKIAAIDKGITIEVDCAIPCPAASMDIPVAGAVCKLDTSLGNAYATNLNLQVTFRVTDCKGSNQDASCEIEFVLGTGKVKASLQLWKPSSSTPNKVQLKYNKVQFATIDNNTRVYIQSYVNQGLLFISSLHHNNIEQNLEKQQLISKCALTAPNLEGPLSIGQVLIAPFKDGNYYRALIRAVEKDRVLVSYIDYGNSDYVNIEKLKTLSPDLQQLPSSVAKVLLKDVSRDVPMTKDVDNYLKKLVEDKTVLVYTMENGVVLKESVDTKNGKSVNTVISELLTPNWIRNKGYDSKTCYMLQDMKIIPLGNVGETVMVYVLQNFDNSQFMLCTYKADVISFIRNSLSKSIAKYCEAHEHYIPREEELCLVRYENVWCRATCLVRDASPTSSKCFLVDLGPLVEIQHTDIRAMSGDFMSPDALACVCTVQNLAPLNEYGEYSSAIQLRLSKLIEKDSPLKVKIVGSSEPGSYEIELPDIHQTLIQERLIEK